VLHPPVATNCEDFLKVAYFRAAFLQDVDLAWDLIRKIETRVFSSRLSISFSILLEIINTNDDLINSKSRRVSRKRASLSDDIMRDLYIDFRLDPSSWSAARVPLFLPSSSPFVDSLAANGTSAPSWIYYKPVNFSRVPFSLISPLLWLLASTIRGVGPYFTIPLPHLLSRLSLSAFSPSLFLVLLLSFTYIFFSLFFSFSFFFPYTLPLANV